MNELPLVELLVSPSQTEILSFTYLFYRINSIIPDTQELVVITPDTSVAEAIQILRKHNFSQLPVVQGQEVLGIFSYRSFSTQIINLSDTKVDFNNLPVDEFIEPPVFIHIFEELETILTHLDKLDNVIVGEPNRLQGIVTPMDVLHHLFQYTSPFVILREIELTLRNILRACVTDDKLQVCIQNSLANVYAPKEPPKTLDQMTLHDFVQIIRDGRNWSNFEQAFGNGDWQRKRTNTVLAEIVPLRNDVFHFKRELTSEDREKLLNHRNWLLKKARAFEAKRIGNNDTSRK